MTYLHDDVLDSGLSFIDDNCDRVFICNAEPSTWAEASSTYNLGYKNNPTISTAEDRDGGGRQVTISAIADGTVSATDTATHFALGDSSETQLIAAGSLSSGVAVTDGNTWTLTEFTIGIPYPS